MARIRSIHPGLASDEVFMSMSFPAQAGWCLLWTECDDHGIFEWKPIVLKARIFPAATIDFATILDEWVALGCIKKVEIDGKPYGLVRNFCKFQRPKSPSYRYSLPKEHELFVGISATPTPALPQDSPSPTEKPPQMKEEEEEEVKKERKKVFRAVAKATRPTLDENFEEFWKVYPRRGGANPKAPASKVFRAFVASGVEAREIITGAQRCAETERAKIGSEFIPQAVKWLRDRRWEDYNAAAAGAHKPAVGTAPEAGFYAAYDSQELDAWDEHWRATRGVNAPRDRTFGWRFPTQWPPDHPNNQQQVAA